MGRTGYADGHAGRGMSPEHAGVFGGRLSADEREYEQVGYWNGRADQADTMTGARLRAVWFRWWFRAMTTLRTAAAVVTLRRPPTRAADGGGGSTPPAAGSGVGGADHCGGRMGGAGTADTATSRRARPGIRQAEWFVGTLRRTTRTTRATRRTMTATAPNAAGCPECVDAPVVDTGDTDDDDREYQAGYELGLTQCARPAECSDQFRAGYIDGRRVADEIDDPDYPVRERATTADLVDAAVRSALRLDDVSVALDNDQAQGDTEPATAVRALRNGGRG